MHYFPNTSVVACQILPWIAHATVDCDSTYTSSRTHVYTEFEGSCLLHELLVCSSATYASFASKQRYAQASCGACTTCKPHGFRTSLLTMLPSSHMVLHDCCFRPLARKAMQLPPSEESLSSATSSPDPAWRRPQPSQAQHGTHQSFHPAASSFAASAANTAASLSSTLREASTVLHKTHSQVLLCSLSACFASGLHLQHAKPPTCSDWPGHAD